MSYVERSGSIFKTMTRGWRYVAIGALFVLPEAHLGWAQQTTIVVQQPSTVVVATPAPVYGAYGAASYAGSVRPNPGECLEERPGEWHAGTRSSVSNWNYF